jgi:hypothetical protein
MLCRASLRASFAALLLKKAITNKRYKAIKFRALALLDTPEILTLAAKISKNATALKTLGLSNQYLKALQSTF